MGYLSSTQKTTSEGKTAPLSQSGLEYQSQFNSMILNILGQAGYEMNAVEKTKYADQSLATNLQNKIKANEAEIQKIQEDLKINPVKQGQKYNKNGGYVGDKDPREARIDSLQQEITKSQSELGNIPQTTYTDFSFEEKPDPRLQDAIDRFGADSVQAREIKESLRQETLFQAEANADIARSYLEKSKKLINGDYSFSNDQKAVADSYFAPVRDVVNKTTDMLLEEANQNEANLFQYVNKYMDQIDQTGIDTLDAMNAALVQVEKSGQNLMNIVEDVNNKYEAKAKFEFDLLSQKADEKAASQSALLGLPPGSPVEKKQAAAMKYDALQSVLLGLEADEANRKLGIASQTEGEKKSISLAKVDLALNQGGKKENLSNTALNIAGQTGATKMGVKGAYAQNMIGLEQDKMKFLYDSAAGQLPQQVGAAQNVMGFNEEKQNQDINQISAGLSPISYGLGIEQQRTFAEAKNTNKQTGSPSIFSAITSGINTAVGAGSAVMDIFGGKINKAGK